MTDIPGYVKLSPEESEVERTRQVTNEEADSYEWWERFLQARFYAIKCMARLGKDEQEIQRTLSFGDPMHVHRLMMINRVGKGPL